MLFFSSSSAWRCEARGVGNNRSGHTASEAAAAGGGKLAINLIGHFLFRPLTHDIIVGPFARQHEPPPPLAPVAHCDSHVRKTTSIGGGGGGARGNKNNANARESLEQKSFRSAASPKCKSGLANILLATRPESSSSFYLFVRSLVRSLAHLQARLPARRTR